MKSDYVFERAEGGKVPTRAKVRRDFPELTKAEAQGVVDHLRRCEHWLSPIYHVQIDKECQHGFAGLTVWHLSIKRIDKQPIRDWRVMQAIKSGVVGAEVEAIELYPAESRVVDTSNQYHLFCFPNGERVPCGYTAGMRTDNPGVEGAVQRPGSGGA